MNKENFFRDLEERLKGLPDLEKDNIRRIYEDLFQRAAENGKGEQEIADSLSYRQPYGYAEQPEPAGGRRTGASSGDSTLKALMASLALGLFNLVFVVWFFIAAAAVLFSLWAVAVSFVFGPVLILIGTEFSTGANDLLLVGSASLILFGLGLLLGLGLLPVSRWFGSMTKNYIRLNIRLIKGE